MFATLAGRRSASTLAVRLQILGAVAAQIPAIFGQLARDDQHTACGQRQFGHGIEGEDDDDLPAEP